MIRFLAIIGMMSTGPAWAGCLTFDPHAEQAPVVEICHLGECDRTRVLRTCANVRFTNADYENGWSVRYDAGPQRGYASTPTGRLVDSSEITCRIIEGEELSGGEPVCRF
ncbi:MAG: hypothetical protein K5872_22325 [Rhizobiaceae bacterium]|nr:hypothetical protein [Rhizobiaceae bacterium]MCV0408958.1 hypothetical protein [Rhizobiaceae bacterium]